MGTITSLPVLGMGCEICAMGWAVEYFVVMFQHLCGVVNCSLIPRGRFKPGLKFGVTIVGIACLLFDIGVHN